MSSRLLPRRRRRDRRAELTRYVSRDRTGIELGPFHDPLAPKKSGFRTLVIDIVDAATLRQRAREDPNIPDTAIERIEEVDILGSSTAIEELIGERQLLGQIDYVVSSHNFEHLPDPIRFLRGCEKVLKRGGVLSMAIPDKRTCFDYFRPYSTLADFLEAYFERRERPSQTQLFEQNSLRCRYQDGRDSLYTFGMYRDPQKIVPLDTLKSAFQQWIHFMDSQDSIYHDTHCWVLAPATFELIIRDLKFLGLTGLNLLEISETHGNEFYVHLQNAGDEQDADPEAHYAKRCELLRRIGRESAPTGAGRPLAALAAAAVRQLRALRRAARECAGTTASRWGIEPDR